VIQGKIETIRAILRHEPISYSNTCRAIVSSWSESRGNGKAGRCFPSNDLSFGLVNSSSSSTKNEAEIQSTSQTNDESSCELSHLVPLAFRTLENILTDPDARKADKLKAATLIGQWGGLTTDFNVALTSLRRYGLVLYQSDDGGWTVKQLLAE